MEAQKKLQWGILGPGRIAHKFAEGIAETDACKLRAVASRDPGRAQAFARKHSDAKAYGDYQSLLDDPELDAVYIATPHPFHAQWAEKAARAGKHILCEKPATLNHREATVVMDAVREAKVFFMEAFMYRCHPQTARMRTLLQDGAIGELRHMRGVFATDQGPAHESRHQAKALGGGGILDLGCYPVSMMRMLAGVACDKDFLNPRQLKALGHLDEITRVDTWTSALLQFDGDILGEAHCGLRLNNGNLLELTGTKGRIRVTSPWFCQGDIILERPQKEPIVETFDERRSLYAFECEVATQAILAGQPSTAAMSPEDTLGNMKSLDRWREEIGLSYENEEA